MPWECAIRSCDRSFGELEGALAHQVREHPRHECRVCGAVVPEGLFAIRHAFGEHTRAEYVRYYDADADEIRRREQLLGTVEQQVDVSALRERIDEATPPASAD
jgi:hypothetical protein